MAIESKDETNRVIELLEALTKMKLTEMLDRELKDSPKKRLYELTGKADRKNLVKVTGMSAGAISGLWQKWYSMGILTKRGKFYYKLFEDENGDQ